VTEAWHYTGSTLRDGCPIPPAGEWLVHDGPLVPGESGLHACTEPWDGLTSAPGCQLHRVELDGNIIPDFDSMVAAKRRILKSHDISGLLARFAIDQVFSVAHLWNMPLPHREFFESGGTRCLKEAIYVQAHEVCDWPIPRDPAASSAMSASSTVISYYANPLANEYMQVQTLVIAIKFSLLAIPSDKRDAVGREFNRRVYEAFEVVP